MNIKFAYLYRDAGNYKNFGEVIFTNKLDLSLAHTQLSIQKRLIEERWFVADKWNLPDLHFKEFDWDSDLDHDWHEYELLEETEEAANYNDDIATFLNWIQTRNK